MTKRTEARTLKGFRDLLPEESLIKEGMLSKLVSVFKSFGYLPIETPHLEYLDVLVGEAGADIQKQLYKFTDQGDREVALRFDLTVPFARYVVQHKHELNFPFKRYAIGSVFRGESPQAGRYREFTQCDFDCVGTSSLHADVETLQVIHEALAVLGVEGFTIRFNSRKIMNGLAKSLGIEDSLTDVLRIIDKLDKIGIEKVKKELSGEIGLNDAAIASILELCSIKQEEESGDTFFAKLEKFRELNPLLEEGIKDLQFASKLLEATTIPKHRIKVDLSIARGLGYYTGLVFETNLNDLPSIGSVCSGGRYDNLTQSFSSDELPGVGASVGLDRLIAGLTELKLLKMHSYPAQILVTQLDPELSAKLISITEILRQKGLSVELYPDAQTQIKKQFKYADKNGHPFVIVVGPDEAERGVMKIKNMASKKEFEVKSTDEILTIVETLSS